MAEKNICGVNIIESMSDATNVLVEENGNLRKLNLKTELDSVSTSLKEEIDVVAASINGVIVAVPVDGWVVQDDGTYTNTILIEQITGTETFDVSLYEESDITEEQIKAFGESVISVETSEGQIVVTASEQIDVLFRIFLRGKIDFGEQNVVFVKDLIGSDIGYDNTESGLAATNVQKAIDENAGSISQLSNPNLLINGDFKVNQRGFSSGSYNLTSITYVVDRFRISSNSSLTINIEDDGITIENTGSDYFVFSQCLENDITTDNGLTASCKVSYVSGDVSLCIHGSQFYNKHITDVGITSISVDSSYSCNQVYLYITSGAKVKVNWMKLECGTNATPFVPRSYAEELAMCMRYFEKGKSATSGSSNIGLTGGYIGVTQRFLVPKRIIPTLTINDGYGHNGCVNRVDIGNYDHPSNTCQLDVKKELFYVTSAGGSNANTLNYEYTADAEIY